MKVGTLVILGVALTAGGISIRADDTVDQAAARAALEQKLYQLDHPNAAPSPDTNSAPLAAQPVESATANVTNAAFAPAAPAAKVPARVAPAKTRPAKSAPVDSDFAQKIPVADASAQTAAIAAMEQKMNELNQPGSQSSADTHSTPPPIAATPMSVPTHEPSAAATPVMETPTAEAPVAVTPAVAPAAVAPVSTAPAVIAPTPKVSAEPAAAPAVAVAPVATPGPVTLSANPPPTVSPAAPTLPSGAPGQVRPANELVTTTGTVYKNVEVQKVTSDAIVISYTPAQGGWALTKVYFDNLPPDIRQQYVK